LHHPNNNALESIGLSQAPKKIAAGFLAVALLTVPTRHGTAYAEPIYYKSGKAPVSMDLKEKNSNTKGASDSKAGTKKDSNFLRCMSNCKSDCQAPSSGLAKVDCFQDCQDQCCNSYEQCSFKSKQTAG